MSINLILLAGTDGYFLRNGLSVPIPVFNFTPINKTPILLHDNNERIHQNTLINGVPLYKNIISSLSAVQ